MDRLLIEISNDGQALCIERGFLKIKNGEKEHRIPTEGILSVVISAAQATLTKNLITGLTAENCPIILCGLSYLPEAIILPYASHCLTSSRISRQVEAALPLKKNLWKTIVEHKISNQVRTLCRFVPDTAEAERLHQLSRSVKSDDAGNNEGQASRIYFRGLFGSDFVRNREAPDINLLLNYAYTVLRAAVARSIAGSGLLPYLGIKHCHPANRMPLVDDMMEPFRPIADGVVLEAVRKYSPAFPFYLTPELKRELCRLLACSVSTPRGRQPLTEALGTYVNSLVKSYESKKVCLVFPEI